MIKYEYVPTDPIPILNISWEYEFDNWQQITIDIQQEYLTNRNEIVALSFEQTIARLRSICRKFDKNYNFSQETIIALSFSAMNLFDFYALFQDEKINEAFCNRIGNRIIINHRTYGRCLTNLEFTKELWNALKIRMEYDSGKTLSPNTPAIKLGFGSPIGIFRISVQDRPLSPNGPIFSIRRLPTRPLRLSDLLDQGQISQEYSDILLDAIKARENIVIAGEPGSGKTTLANALLLETNPSWRLIIMEDAKEINIDPETFPLTIHYNMPSVGDDDRYSRREDEIARILHRSPDYVFLGELQNKNDTTVAFEGFSAGIRGMATTHARSIEGLLSRWKYSHKLPEELIKSISYIVVTKRELLEYKARLTVENVFKIVNGQVEEII